MSKPGKAAHTNVQLLCTAAILNTWCIADLEALAGQEGGGVDAVPHRVLRHAALTCNSAYDLMEEGISEALRLVAVRFSEVVLCERVGRILILEEFEELGLNSYFCEQLLVKKCWQVNAEEPNHARRLHEYFVKMRRQIILLHSLTPFPECICCYPSKPACRLRRFQVLPL